jgi:excisionase family DNA binding protein
MIPTPADSIRHSGANYPSLAGLPEVLTTREGAQVLRCSKAHFCNLLLGKVSGVPRLPSVRLGRRCLVRKATLMQWIEEVELRARR